MSRYLLSNVLAVVGALIGGTLGFYTFGWLYDHHYYGPMIPGAFLGLGSGLLARHYSLLRGILCGVSAFLLSLFTEWWFRWSGEDQGLQGFLGNLSGMTWAMIVGGSLIAFWVSKDAERIGRGRRPVE
jgi:hypothetical protein